MTATIGALLPGERLLSKLVGLPKEDFVLACLRDRRIRRTTLAQVSGYSTLVLREMAQALESRPIAIHARVIDDVHQALVVCASRVHLPPLGHVGFRELGYVGKSCKTGQCDEVMRRVQALLYSRTTSATAVIRKLGKSRPWFYVTKQNAMRGCQTATQCENWELILNAFENRPY